MQEFIVSTLEDEDDGDFSAGDFSLREALSQASNGDIVSFDSNLNGSIILTEGSLNIPNALTINGSGAENIIIDGNGRNRVFNIDGVSSGTTTISGVTIANGSAGTGAVPFGGGGGIRVSDSTLILENSIVRDNNSFFSGGGIDVLDSADVTITNSLVTGNTGGDGSVSAPTSGGISNLYSTLTLNNSTVTQNTGGEISNFASSDSIVNINNSTITGTVREFEGRNPNPFDGYAVFNITSSIITSFSSQTNSTNSGGNNLIGGSDSFVPAQGDLVGTLDNPLDPLLGELQDNGGATPTIALLDGSPAIDAGSNPNGLGTDQRGEGFSRTIGNGTDIGAFELQTVTNVSEIVGTAGGDVLSGTEAGELIQGLDGNDTIRGFGGDDTLRGDNGNDSLEGGAGNDLIEGLEGFDSLFGGEGNDSLDGGIGNDSLDGGAGDDQLLGLDGRDTLLGGNDNDILDGGAGVDFLRGDEGDDQLFGGDDNDTLFGSNGNDTLDGGFGIDSLDGGAGNDSLLGLDGNDSVFGGNGNDTLDGGLGNDSLRGDDGDDTFVLSPGSGTDFIVDFGRGNNLLGLSSGISFSDLSFSGNNIALGTEILATLNGFDTANLTENNFVDV